MKRIDDEVTSKKIDDEVFMANCDVIVIFPIYGKFRAIWSRIPNVLSVKLTFSLTVTFYVTKK